MSSPGKTVVIRGHLVSLAELPNVDSTLADALDRVEIKSADELRCIGAKAVWVKMVRAGFPRSAHALLALEGAIQGVAWQSLPAESRRDLVRFAGRAND